MSSHDYTGCQDQACELCAAFSAVLGIMNTNPLPQDVVDCLRTCAGLVCKATRFKNLTLSTSMPTPEAGRRDRRRFGMGGSVRGVPRRGLREYPTLPPAGAPMTTPKYRTDSRACSCAGFWYRRTCRHYRAYAAAVALLVAQNAVNETYSPIGVNLTPIGVLTIPDILSGMVNRHR